MDWFVRYTTIKGEEEAKGADQFHVKVKFNSDIMTFFVSPDWETLMSLREKIAHRIQRPFRTICLLYNGKFMGWPFGSTLTQCRIRNGECLEVELIHDYCITGLKPDSAGPNRYRCPEHP